MSYRTRLITALAVLLLANAIPVAIVASYSAAAIAAIMFVFGAMFGYMAALQIERPAPIPPPHVDSQPPATRRELVIYEVPGKEVL